MKSLLSLLFCLLLFTPGISQGLGIRGGYSLTNWRGLVLEGLDFENETLNGFHLGFYGSVELSETVFMEPGVFYSRKGSGGSITDGSFDISVENRGAYLDAPLLFRFYFGGFNLVTGPQASLLLSNEIEITQTDLGTGQNVSSTEDTADQFQDIELGFVFGLGYELDNGLNFSLTYDLGLTDILLEEEALSSPTGIGNYYSWVEAKNRVVKLSIGVTF